MACHAWAYSIGMQAFEDLGYHFLSSKCTIHHPPSPTDSSTVQRSSATSSVAKIAMVLDQMDELRDAAAESDYRDLRLRFSATACA